MGQIVLSPTESVLVAGLHRIAGMTPRGLQDAKTKQWAGFNTQIAAREVIAEAIALRVREIEAAFAAEHDEKVIEAESKNVESI